MNSKQQKILNLIKNALRQRQYTITIKNSKANIAFFRFLLCHDFILGIERKNTNAIVFLKYNSNFDASFKDYSVVKKNFISNYTGKKKSQKTKNFIKVLSIKNNNQVVAKFR